MFSQMEPVKHSLVIVCCIVDREVLYNEYWPISKDDWNQTLRKSSSLYKTWPIRKIRTKYDGYYHDQISGNREDWKRNTEIALGEIITLKLYTDYAKLQFEMKQCLRFDILDGTSPQDPIYQQKKYKLLDRMSQFYHWRGALLIVLNKFATKLSRMREIPLYCGINRKMLLKRSPSRAFCGPLSTSISLRVAKTFATRKGTYVRIFISDIIQI